MKATEKSEMMLSVQFPSHSDDEMQVSLAIEPESIRVSLPDYNSISIDLRDFDRIAAEVARFRKAQEIIND